MLKSSNSQFSRYKMKESIIKRLSAISENEMSVLSEDYSIASDAETAFANMKLRRRDYIYNVIDLSKTVSACPHTRFIDIPIHSHNYIEIMYVVRGCIRHVINGKTFDIKEGQLIMMNRHLSHAINASGENDIAVNLIVSSDYVGIASARFRGDPSLRDFAEQEEKENGEGRFLIYDVEYNPYAEALIENLICQSIFEDDTPKGILRETLSLLLRHFEAKPKMLIFSSSGDMERDPVREKIGSYIQSFYKTASLSELASHLTMSEPYVSKRIKELFGATFTELVCERRFSEAEQLLLHSDLPITEIAEAVGYDNNSFFHRRFRERYGISPSKWRKENKTGP